MMYRNAVLSVIAVAAAASPAAGADPESEFRGRRIAEANCAECHAIAQFDESAVALAPPFRELSRRAIFATLRQALAGELFTRHPVMPDFEPTREQADDIVDFIDSLQERP